ncbi:MAG: group III truncated hemoglobin [Sediminibacterium sp.]|nr:group III truncated hemoglobin [Sediminibacterium sp.]
MKKDITNRSDIERLIKLFYNKVIADEMLGTIFNDVAKVNWQKHLPLMCDFWENLLLFTGSYEGNPMDLHKHLHRLMNLQQAHFQQWNKLFLETIDQNFKGANSLIAKQRALKISSILQSQILPQKADNK